MDIADLADRHIEDNLLIALADINSNRERYDYSIRETDSCTSCGEAIPRQRLIALPGCRQCVTCAEKSERKMSHYRKGSIVREEVQVFDDYLI